MTHYNDKIMVTCTVCDVTWDLDMEPPKCDHDGHPWTTEVIMIDVPE